MEHESLFVLVNETVDDLLILSRSKSCGHERLRFATRKESGSVRTRQDLHFGRDGTNFVERSSGDALAVVDNVLAL